jgi:HD superfamily phosphohydrolase YqeK
VYTDSSVNRVRNMALKLAPTLDEKPDMLVLELIALFHDMAGRSYPILYEGY